MSCCEGSCLAEAYCPIAPLGGAGSDLTVVGMSTVRCYASLNGTAAFAFGAMNCNAGTKMLHWFDEAKPDKRPVFAQNLYRLTEDPGNGDDRFEQIGMAWVKYAFSAPDSALQECVSTVGACCAVETGQYFGIGCGDTYDASYNGQQGRLGPRSDINPVTGDVDSHMSEECDEVPEGFCCRTDPTCRRVQVAHADLDPAQNPPATTRYYAEGQWVSVDEATEPTNRDNNASYREVVVSEGTSCTYDIAVAPGSVTVKEKPAIEEWLSLTGVVGTDILVDELPQGQTGSLILATKATDLQTGWWQYEYALYNMNSHRAVESFALPLVSGTSVCDVGFHDVDYHSGEECQSDVTDWEPSGTSTLIQWEAPDPPAPPCTTGMQKNALRWGTLYNFRFRADAAPGGSQGNVTLGLYRDGPPGSPSTVTALT